MVIKYIPKKSGVKFMVKNPMIKEEVYMARPGENIRKRKDNRWEGRYRVYSEEKGKIVYKSVYGKSYKEVKAKKQAWESRIRDKEIGLERNRADNAGKDILFRKVAEEWLEEVKKLRKPSTHIKYSMIYHKQLEIAFHDAVLSDITDTFVREKISVGLSDSLTGSIYCVLNRILRFASEKYGITLSILKKPEKTEHRNRPVKILGRAEQEKMFVVLYCTMDIFKVAVLLCLYTGMRLGELCALKWDDIDLKNKTVTISRTVQRLYVQGCATKTILVETSPKSAHSKREIPLSAEVLELLLKFYNGKKYVFGGDKPMEPRKMQYHFKEILKEARLEDKNFHALRHTFATNCIEGGMDVKSLSEILGHSNVQITMNRYVHPSMDTKRKYMNALSGIYGHMMGQVG